MVVMELHFFSKTLFGYLVNDQFKTDISDMSDFNSKNKLKEIIAIKQRKANLKIKSENDKHFQVGYNKFSAGIYWCCL